MITNIDILAKFENEFRPLPMKAIYPDDVSDINYMLTTDCDKAYVEANYAAVLDMYRPYIIISISVREVIDNSRRDEERQRKQNTRHVSGFGFNENQRCTGLGMCSGTGESIEMSKRLHQAIDQLSPIAKSRIIKYYFEGKDFRQIAAEEGKAVSSVHESIEYALKKIKKYL